jgi:hypothetical protein
VESESIVRAMASTGSAIGGVVGNTVASTGSATGIVDSESSVKPVPELVEAVPELVEGTVASISISPVPELVEGTFGDLNNNSVPHTTYKLKGRTSRLIRRASKLSTSSEIWYCPK